MKTLPYSPLPITHKARAYVSADKTNVAAMIEELVEPIDAFRKRLAITPAVLFLISAVTAV